MILRVDERVEDRHRGAARQPEDVLDPFALEAADQRLGAGLELGDRLGGGSGGGGGAVGTGLVAGWQARETSLSNGEVRSYVEFSPSVQRFRDDISNMRCRFDLIDAMLASSG